MLRTLNPRLNPDHALAERIDRAYMEVIPTATILDRLRHLPRHAYVSITCSPVHGIEPTLRLTEQLRALPDERRLKLVPHIAARMVRDRGHLREILLRLQELRVESVFVPGGDAPQPAGEYGSSLELLRDMSEIGHTIEDVGVAAHPEGHPLVDEAELMKLLREKQPFATYFVSQMCFDPAVLIGWLRRVRAAGIMLPAWLGLPGVVEVPKLLALSLRIGVGQSVKVLRRQKGMVRRVIRARPYQPDDLLAGIAPHLCDPTLDIPGFHLFGFNNVQSTERWRLETLNKLCGGPNP